MASTVGRGQLLLDALAGYRASRVSRRARSRTSTSRSSWKNPAASQSEPATVAGLGRVLSSARVASTVR